MLGFVAVGLVPLVGCAPPGEGEGEREAGEGEGEGDAGEGEGEGEGDAGEGEGEGEGDAGEGEGEGEGDAGEGEGEGEGDAGEGEGEGEGDAGEGEGEGEVVDNDGDGIANDSDPAPNNPCSPNVDVLACNRGDVDGDGVRNDQDDDPLDACVPDANAAACGAPDSDGDGLNDVADPAPQDACVPSSDVLACAVGDVDGDGVANGNDAAPEDACVPSTDVVACPSGDVDRDGVDNGTDGAPEDPCVPSDVVAACDDDGDGLSNGDEIVLGTRPDQADSDGDTLDDDVEHPGAGVVDSDGDGTIDGLDADDDNDGAPTASEVATRLDPCAPNADALACPTGDTDNDGVTNANDADPQDPCVPNACAGGDSDGDGVPDADDICDGYDDLADEDADGAPDGCDLCPLVDDASPTCFAHGVPRNGFPRWTERLMETAIDMVRGDPIGFKASFVFFNDATGANVFNSTDYPPQDPLIGELELQQAARFQADQFVNQCPEVNVSHDSCDGTSFFARVDSFYSRGSPTGEIAAPDFWTDPLDIVSTWICDGAAFQNGAQVQCRADGDADGHRDIIMTSTGEMGAGEAHTAQTATIYGAVVDFGSFRPSVKPRVASAAHRFPDGGGIEYLLVYFDTVAPTSVTLVRNGVRIPMELDLGTLQRGTWRAFETPAPSGCVPYFFEAVTGSGALERYPATGAFATFKEGVCGVDFVP